MNDHSARTISTVAIWIATACIYIFGIFRFNWNGAFPGILWMIVALAIATAAGTATGAIWRRPSAGENNTGVRTRAESEAEAARR